MAGPDPATHASFAPCRRRGGPGQARAWRL